MQSRGFTLIELLIVISIIGILSSILLMSVNFALKYARDAERLAQVDQIINAIALYYFDHGQYPGYDPSDSGEAFYSSPGTTNHSLTAAGYIDPKWNDTDGHDSGSLENILEDYIPEVPADPLNTFGKSTDGGDTIMMYAYYPGDICPSTPGHQAIFMIKGFEVMEPYGKAPCGGHSLAPGSIGHPHHAASTPSCAASEANGICDGAVILLDF